MNDILYCDDCGEALYPDHRDWRQQQYMDFSEVPYDVASANKGESALVCLGCHASRLLLT